MNLCSPCSNSLKQTGNVSVQVILSLRYSLKHVESAAPNTGAASMRIISGSATSHPVIPHWCCCCVGLFSGLMQMLELLCSMGPTELWNYEKSKKELIRKEITFTETEEGQKWLVLHFPFHHQIYCCSFGRNGCFCYSSTLLSHCVSNCQNLIGLTKLLLVDKAWCLKQSQQNKK